MYRYNGNYRGNSSKNNDTSFLDRFTEKAQRIIRRHKEYNPVIIEKGAVSICKSWWGNAWCQNLERYADWENRIERGKDYLKHNTVVDLQINGGHITSKVQGAAWSPYEIDIVIDPISKRQCQEISKEASGEIKDIESLIAGKFPRSLKTLFFQTGGLFPNPREIHFNCNCPDYARLCKHTIAALYGIGVRLDSNPLYFFQMRGIDLDLFIAKAIGDGVESMLENSNVKSKRIIQNADLLQMFGIE